MLTVEEIIEYYLLEPLDQEGGLFRQVWRSPLRVENEQLGGGYPIEGTHAMGTVIHFLLTEGSFSAMHRLPTPEHWFYHMGDPAEMLLLHHDGAVETVEIGADLAAGQRVHVTTPSYAWQGTRLEKGGRYGYFFGSCVMVPGFEWTDFKLGDADTLSRAFPEAELAIRERCREAPPKGKK